MCGCQTSQSWQATCLRAEPQTASHHLAVLFDEQVRGSIDIEVGHHFSFR
jgi:hypothetical protein